MARRKRSKQSKRRKSRSRITKSLLLRLARGWRKIIGPWLSRRKEYAEKFGRNAFLDPKRLKYPYVDPRTGKPSIKGLAAAALRALQHGKMSVYRKAISKLKRLLSSR